MFTNPVYKGSIRRAGRGESDTDGPAGNGGALEVPAYLLADDNAMPVGDDADVHFYATVPSDLAPSYGSELLGSEGSRFARQLSTKTTWAVPLEGYDVVQPTPRGVHGAAYDVVAPPTSLDAMAYSTLAKTRGGSAPALATADETQRRPRLVAAALGILLLGVALGVLIYSQAKAGSGGGVGSAGSGPSTHALGASLGMGPGVTVPVDCVAAWSPYGNCSAACGGGVAVSTYTIASSALNFGVGCPFRDGATVFRSCNTQPCAEGDCVGAWGDFGACNATCGGGVRTRTYSVVSPAAAATGGAACSARHGTVLAQQCNVHACPVPCVAQWSGWSDCSGPCDVGTQSRRYTVAVAAAYGGTPCEAANNSLVSRICACPPVIACVGAYGAYGTCSATCGAGTRTRVFQVATPAANGGAACPVADGFVETSPCPDLAPCPGALFA
jgi:hypothetical protein